ncbi:Hypothetical predicted protein [Marmota monax]|uniref:Ig-like domain-containing protein n=1 Tax=Marmota monax TaxID=9995 RepID=A0A5E4CYI7_MARMO|nr:Hypothetical predicted protein [Marmota monax]
MCVGEKANFQKKQLSGNHSLHYNLTVRSQGGLVQSRSFADGYWDHQLFLHYDSDSKESPKPQGPWAEKPLGNERWNIEIQELKEHIKKAKATLADINAQQEQRGGSHSLQEIWGCKIEEDNCTRSFWMIYYDGEPFLSYHPETRSLRVEPSSAQTLAMEVKNSWDEDGIQSKDIWAQVQGELCGKLRTYQVSWKGSSLSPGASAQETLLSPTVNMTCGETSEDTINVTCWACGFYPQNISVTWLQDAELLSQDTQDSVDVFPYGNGTYQTWLSTRIPQGQEQRFSCHVVHIGKNTTVPVSCGVGLWKGWPIFLSVAVLIMTVMIPVCVYCCKKSKTPSAAEASGTHSLHYNLTVRFQGGSVQSRFFADCYWDHQLFLHYDNHDKESAKPQELWAEKPLGTENWDTEIWELIEHGQNLKATLAEINAQQEQKGGSHSLQETWGCKIEEDNHTRGFWNFHYDGEPFLSYHPETRSWKVEPSSAQTLAMEVKNSWDADGIQSKVYQAHVQGELCGRFRRYQVSWKGSSLSCGASAQGNLLSPAVNVTCGEALEDTINMTCWAFGFYPQNISVTWLQDGEPQSQDTQQSWGVFPYVNGTYQTWVSIRIPQGQEQRFCCYVGYRGNNSTGLVSCGEPGHSCRSFQPGESVTPGGERGEALRLWYPECNKPAFKDCTAA